MQRELRRFAHSADDQEDADDASRADRPTAEDDRSRGRQQVQGLGVIHDFAEAERAGDAVEIGDAKQHDDIGDARGGEGFDGCFVGAFFFEPESDQEIGTDAHDFPADEEQQDIVGDDQGEHGAGEKRNQREEARLTRVVSHVADGINEDHQNGDGHHDQHDHGGRIDQNAHEKRGIACIHPGDAVGEDILAQVMQLGGFAQNDPTDDQRPDDAGQTDEDADDATGSVDHRYLHALIIRMMTAVFVMIGGGYQFGFVADERDDEKSQQGAGRDKPGQQVWIVEEIHCGA